MRTVLRRHRSSTYRAAAPRTESSELNGRSRLALTDSSGYGRRTRRMTEKHPQDQPSSCRSLSQNMYSALSSKTSPLARSRSYMRRETGNRSIRSRRDAAAISAPASSHPRVGSGKRGSSITGIGNAYRHRARRAAAGRTFIRTSAPVRQDADRRSFLLQRVRQEGEVAVEGSHLAVVGRDEVDVGDLVLLRDLLRGLFAVPLRV